MGALFSALMAKITGGGAMLEVENDATCDCTCCATTYEVDAPDAPDCSAQHTTDEHNFDEVPVPGLDDAQLDGSWKTVEPTDSQKTKLDI